ncbi:MAG: hypothetical protein M3247_07740 [Thermoproteota archaeon]|nr:hypothetical protein [Thermoproteota archaeon]
MICYAQKYLPVLETGDATVLTTLSGPCRRHVMEALTAYSKYNGTYQRWQEIRQAHLLKWTNGNESFTSLQRFFNPSLTLDLMLQQIRRMIEKLPVQMAQIVRFGCLVGLRPAETVESVRLINNQLLFSKYYNADNQTLEHFRFPDIFLRQTKKAYISFVNPEILSEIVKDSDLEKNCKIPSHNYISRTCNRRGIPCSLHFCRKVFASWLHKYGISTEIVDFLQGRVSTSVFSRHYLTPDSSLKDRVLTALHELQKLL